MGIDYQGKVIGAVSPQRVGALPAAGGALLRFSLEWTVHPRRDHDFSIFGTYITVAVAPEGEATFVHLGHGFPEVAWTEQAREGMPYASQLIYNLTLSASQLLALEQSRQQRGLVFQIEIRGNALGADGIRSVDDSRQLSVPLSEWLRVLAAAGVTDSLLIGMPLPLVTEPGAAEAPTTLIRQAHQYLLQGDFDACVARCRQALESLAKIHGLNAELESARAASASKDRKGMSKRARALAISEAIRHFTHTAHHVDAGGAPEIFSRQDALLTLSGTAALAGIVSAPTTLPKTAEQTSP